MRWMRRGARLSIFARTFLLMVAALVVAEGIGLAIFFLRPPMPAGRMEPFGGPPHGERRMPPPSRLEGSPRRGPASFDEAGPPGRPPGGGMTESRAFGWKAIGFFGVGLVVLLPLAGLFARALSSPIRRFAEASRKLGMDAGAPPLQRDGPAEMLAAIDSFNAMQARLNRLMQERAHMIGAIAHDLRTPLTRLAFRLDDLQSPLKEKVEADITEMKLMISAALDFLRDRALGAQRERLDFRLLVESVVDDQGDVGHDVRLEPGGSILLEGDPVALRRMVSNLVDNALKYGDRARLKVREAEDHCVLEIDDDGPGIPEALQERVFDPFFRAETSRNRDTGGIGLGLASVRAIVLDHGGSISLRNRKEGGLRVDVTLPL